MGILLSGLRDILNQMADQISNVIDDEYEAIQVEPSYVLAPADITVDMYPGDIARDSESAAFDDISGGYFITVRARINPPHDFDGAYDFLISMMDDEDPMCLALAILDQPTLGGHASSVDVRDPTGLRLYESPTEGSHIGFQFTVLAIPAKS